ncbi:hypothetical protein [Adhaeribacter pallidiroseus]|uniref:Uncharacterized protein n=1 Tax=Adhaeribacter pallidiroseus TaxID=2072847 RepID=A0A369QGW2_9BACT|nr:hypothetical protein [Adhaeribacter pallidiroseus]RDC62507.1 hypothetical protein AHMF7616_01101 [Adhaeribacter pallidiroseus]
MKYTIKITSAQTISEIPNYWTNPDYMQLLEKFNYPDADKAEKETLEELLLMAITDYEPNEAAAIVLEYKLADKLNDGQIQQISNDMLLDKISEEYPDISLHATLFPVNQLLFKAFNGKFPNTKATLIQFSIEPENAENILEFTKEDVLHLFQNGLSERTLIKRLFGEQIAGSNNFPEAASILWELQPVGNNHYTFITSDYWLSKDDLVADEFSAELVKEPKAEEIQ